MSEGPVIKAFDSPLAYLEWASNAPCLWRGELQSREESRWGTGFTGTRNYQEAYDLARCGWAEGLKLLSREFEAARRLVPPAARPVNRYDLAGFYSNPGRAAAGEMFSMVAPAHGDLKRKPVMRISGNFAYAVKTPVETIMRWGAAICSYIDGLEQAGESVQLDYIQGVKRMREVEGVGHPGVSFQFPLKKAGQPLSLISLIFWMAHPSSYRRVGFSAMERLDVEKWYTNGYGYPSQVTSPAPGTLYLTIKDAGKDMRETLDNIRAKHMELGVAAPAAPAFAPR